MCWTPGCAGVLGEQSGKIFGAAKEMADVIFDGQRGGASRLGFAEGIHWTFTRLRGRTRHRLAMDVRGKLARVYIAIGNSRIPA